MAFRHGDQVVCRTPSGRLIDACVEWEQFEIVHVTRDDDGSHAVFPHDVVRMSGSWIIRVVLESYADTVARARRTSRSFEAKP